MRQSINLHTYFQKWHEIKLHILHKNYQITLTCWDICSSYFSWFLKPRSQVSQKWEYSGSFLFFCCELLTEKCLLHYCVYSILWQTALISWSWFSGNVPTDNLHFSSDCWGVHNFVFHPNVHLDATHNSSFDLKTRHIHTHEQTIP